MIRTRPLSIFALLLLLFALGGCGSAGYHGTDGDDDDDSSEAPGDDDDDDDDDNQSPTPTPEPGQLTAGDWDDNRNFDRFVATLEDLGANHPEVTVTERYVIHVTNNGVGVPNARVRVESGGTTHLDATTATDGRLLFLPEVDGGSAPYTVRIGSGSGVSAPSGNDWSFDSQLSTTLPAALDLAFVVDATGSMSDEMQYLKSEIDDIASLVGAAFPNCSMRFALIVYRDEGDAYVTRVFNFTNDLSQFQADLGDQSAKGGGDYPEAMQQAMADANQLSWSDGNVARVLFLVADAPPHDEDVQAFLDEANTARLNGVKIFPVASSGVANTAELVMRVAAHASLARYIFLTDDSGIGNSHAEPHIPCYQVTYLNKTMARMINSVLGGEHIPPDPVDVIREVGNPQDGVCTLEDGSTAYL